MANNKNNVTTGKPKIGGSVFVAPIGSTIPTDAVTDLAAAFKNLGYCSDDGLKNNGSRTVDKIKAWGGAVVLTTQSEKVDEYKITLIESMNPEVLKVVNGDNNVTGTIDSGLTVTSDESELADHIFVFDMILRGGILQRIVIPCGAVTNVEEVTYNDKSAVGYAITITAMPDTNGKTSYKYYKNPSVPSITLDKHEASVADGSTLTLTATTYPAGETVTWSSSDSAIASVSNGVVTGEDPGICKITAAITVSDVTYKAECYINVTSAT